MDNERFPFLIRELYRIVADLETMFPGRPFTPDGHMVGSLGEVYAAHFYGLELYACSHQGHDARGKDCEVQIKATQGQAVSIRSDPERLLVLFLKRDGTFEEVYNGPGAPVWATVSMKKRPSNGAYQVRLSALRRMMDSVPLDQRLPLIRNIPSATA